MNILYTKSRNRLSLYKLNKLIFIYINSRSLRADRDNINGKAQKGRKQIEGVDTDDPLNPEVIELQRLDLEDDFAMLRTIFPEDFELDDFISTESIGKRRRADSIEVIPEVQADFQGFQGLPDQYNDLEFQAFGNDYWDHLT
jgi:hypothetical protein